MSGETLGRRLLLLDAIYCAGAGAVALVLFAPLAGLLETARVVPLVAGAATLVWAFLLFRLAQRSDWRRPVAAVSGANAAAAAGLAVLAVLSPDVAGGLLLAAVAIEVAAFAGAQAVAVRR